ncbi:MAG: hypothetical protein HRU78_14375 [Gammaproteobacteria bacterium]|nr:MAG: hypothetical protein HRU78_14375 [Gammaproteobacteria bacterium]
MSNPNWLDEVIAIVTEERVTSCYPVLPQEKQRGNKITEPETRMDKGSNNSVTPVTPVTPENDRFEKKSADILETQREQRREKVLAILAKTPDTQRAFVVDTAADPKHVIVTIAIRDQYTFEMQIPKYKYDPFMLLELIERGAIQ